jgi:hypothetical protein
MARQRTQARKAQKQGKTNNKARHKVKALMQLKKGKEIRQRKAKYTGKARQVTQAKIGKSQS